MPFLIPSRWFYLSTLVLVGLFISGFFWPAILPLSQIAAGAIFIFLIIDGILNYRVKDPVSGIRIAPNRLSLGDNNDIILMLESKLPYRTKVIIIDELPLQLQVRNFRKFLVLSPGIQETLVYSIRPTTRGDYQFGSIILLIHGPFNFTWRRFEISFAQVIPVYPSFLQMRKFELMATGGYSRESGIRKHRRIGHSLEFEQIKDYVPGDDTRAINWKATARTGHLMVNQFQDERSQSVFAVIDMSRNMQRAFRGLTYLDWSINTSLAVLNIVIKKGDKAGLFTFSNKMHATVPAENKSGHLQKIIHTLHAQQTDFFEPDFRLAVRHMNTVLSTRSLIFLFTNPESVVSLNRTLNYWKILSGKHILVVIFFRNSELADVIESTPKTIPDIYRKAIAESIAIEKEEMFIKLRQAGIYPVLTDPENLSSDTINQYLELKSRGLI